MVLLGLFRTWEKRTGEKTRKMNREWRKEKRNCHDLSLNPEKKDRNWKRRRKKKKKKNEWESYKNKTTCFFEENWKETKNWKETRKIRDNMMIMKRIVIVFILLVLSVNGESWVESNGVICFINSATSGGDGRTIHLMIR